MNNAIHKLKHTPTPEWLKKREAGELSELQKSLHLYEWVYEQILAGNMELTLKDLGHLEPYILVPITEDCPDTNLNVNNQGMGYSKTFDIFYNEVTCMMRKIEKDEKEYYHLLISGGMKDKGRLYIEPDKIKEGVQNTIKALKIAINLYR